MRILLPALFAALMVASLACQSSEEKNGGKAASNGNSGSSAAKTDPNPTPPPPRNGPDGKGSPQAAGNPSPGGGESGIPNPDAAAAEVIDLAELASLSQKPGKFTFYPGDVIEINIFEEPEFKNILIRISNEMKINFPYAGTIDLQGLGIIELESELKKRLEQKMLSLAQVSVFLKTPAKRWIYTLGKLKLPQAFEIPVMGSLSVADAVSLSRGFADDADRAMVEISRVQDGRMVQFLLHSRYFKTFFLRPGDKVRVREVRSIFVRGEVREPGAFLIPEYGMTVEEAITKAKVKEDANLNRIVVERHPQGKKRHIVTGARLDFRLQPGDMVTVSELRRVYVIGSVKKPGGFAIPTSGLRATMAVALAEGWTRLAAPNDTYVKRKMPDGSTRVFEVPLKDIMQGNVPEKNIELEPGDEVYVPESFF